VVARAFLALVLAGAVAAGAAAAAVERPPTLKERAAVTAALPSYLRAEPVGCVWLNVALSKNGRWAKVTPVYLSATRMPCLKYAANGRFFLRRTARWKVVFNGSDLPACSLGVPRSLSPCRR
jgi:hypothetical protein